ncbi:pitrilysin family protein [Emcibacter sp. SYSU 3D8]|uniref:M16 family metallopeptidase n=1 Tax=Emcibacter sp. SYSU 3D8 TaxID=3133969 RepID=UPI0031FF1D15
MLIALSGASQARAAEALDSHEYTLGNGLKLLVIEDHRAPIVTHMAWYRVGATEEFGGKTGLAHFLEHLMFKGTEKVPAGEFSKTVSRNGGQDNAFTSSDYTAYFQQVATDKLPLVMEMEADRMVNLKIAEDEVNQERDVVIEERRTRTENSPPALFREQMDAAQFLSHPYRVPVIGWMNDIKRLTRADALGFYKLHYAPNNAVVVVVGDVDADAVKALADRTYGVIPAKPVPPRTASVEAPQLAARELVMTDARVSQVSWVRTYSAPSYQYGDSQLAVPLEVLNEILGGGTTSRLYQTLVVQKQLAIEAGSSYGGYGLGPSTFGISVRPQNDDPAPIPAAVDAVIADLAASGVTDEELKRAKKSLKAAAVYARDSGQGLANIFGASLVTGRSVEDVMSWPDKIEAVTNAEIIAAARTIFVPQRSVTGLLLPDRAGAPAAAPSAPPPGPEHP